eukprot:COSAG01_NODE_6285_length_3753_cov_7.145047_9_plen_69_part_00
MPQAHTSVSSTHYFITVHVSKQIDINKLRSSYPNESNLCAMPSSIQRRAADFTAAAGRLLVPRLGFGY